MESGIKRESSQLAAAKLALNQNSSDIFEYALGTKKN